MEYKEWHGKNDTYEGSFLGDSFHGFGTYKWKDSNVYEGSFYSNARQGYALLSLPNNSNFEGLFIENQPFGPGILTYSNGCQDVGFWLGHKLVRLSRAVDYIIPRLAPTLTAKLKLLRFRRIISLNEEGDASITEILEKYGYGTLRFRSPYSRFIYNTKSVFFDKEFFDRHLLNDDADSSDLENDETLKEAFSQPKWTSAFENHICNSNVFLVDYEYDRCSNNKSLPDDEMGILTYYSKYGNLDDLNTDIFPNERFPDFGPDDESTVVEIPGNPQKNNETSPKILSWNRGDLCTEIVRQIYRHRSFEDKINFKITELMSGVRTEFRKTGEKERLCLYFLKMCSLGPPNAIKELLCDMQISPELMDSRGNNGLMFASAGDQHEIIDILSDYGTSVNSFNDENLTPLNLCLLRRLALANGIYNWEMAFLPPGEDEIGEEPEMDILPRQETISSLDRIFGDGMSIHDFRPNESPIVFDDTQAAAHPAESERRSTGQKSLDGPEKSQITVLNFKNLTDATIDSKETSLVDASFLTGERNPTFDVKNKKVPKSFKREEYVKSIEFSAGDRYLFNLHVKEVLPVVEKGKKGSGKEDKTRKSTIETILEEERVDPHILQKLNEIDETIDKLLRRGADPNLSDVPKPSIHLGIFTHNFRTVYSLLRYGADPNQRLCANEGSLTPLHVLVLLEPRPEHIEICRILLEFGGDAEFETHPDFFMREEEKDFLNESQGRTPLQLLCMRPDIEYGDPFGHLISLAVLLAKISNKKHLYNGHSGLTLAMLYGNAALLEAFLSSGCYDPNQILKGLGSPLHVLTSTFFQKQIPYESSIKMVDILLAAGADPLLNVITSSLELGNCVDYGYAEVEIEKNSRKAGQKGKGTTKTEKGGNRDHLKDHIRVLEYLSKKQQEKLGYVTLTDDVSSKRTSKTFGDERLPSKKSELHSEKTSEKSKRVELLEGLVIPEKKIHREPVETAPDDKQVVEDDRMKEAGNKIGKKIQKKKNDEPPTSNLNRSTGTSRGDSVTTATVQVEKSQPFSQLLLKSLLELFGNCTDFDLNQFALPYVVLRNGNFYYKFHGSKVPRKEQYSLV